MVRQLGQLVLYGGGAGVRGGERERRRRRRAARDLPAAADALAAEQLGRTDCQLDICDSENNT